MLAGEGDRNHDHVVGASQRRRPTRL
jgi:hypothetical protein